jgi:outer membrane protein assembly factor BamB
VVIRFRLVSLAFAVTFVLAVAGNGQAHGILWRHADGGYASTLAADAQDVFLVSGGALHAFDALRGTERWHSDDEGFSAPAYGASLVVALNDRGLLRAFDAESGTLRWSIDTPALRVPAPAPGPPLASSVAQMVAYGNVSPVLGGFFVIGHVINGSFAVSVRADGHVWWQRRFPGTGFNRVAASNHGIVYVLDTEDGAIASTDVYVFRLASPGGVLDVTNGGGPVTADDRGAWIAYAWNSGSTTFGIIRLGAANGYGQAAQWLYTPNNDPKASLPGFGEIAIDGGYVYGQTHEVAGNSPVRAPIYRYRLAPPAGQTALRVIDDGHWIGGTDDGRLVVERDDGLWLFTVTGRTVRALHAMTYDASTAHADVIAFDRSVVYAGFSDGPLVALDARTGRKRFESPHACPDDWRAIIVRGPIVVARCNSSTAAFERVATS